MQNIFDKYIIMTLPVESITALTAYGIYGVSWIVVSILYPADVVFSSIEFISALLFALLSFYNINCIAQGECHALAWINVVALIVVLITGLLAKIHRGSSKTNTKM